MSVTSPRVSYASSHWSGFLESSCLPSVVSPAWIQEKDQATLLNHQPVRGCKSLPGSVDSDMSYLTPYSLYIVQVFHPSQFSVCVFMCACVWWGSASFLLGSWEGRNIMEAGVYGRGNCLPHGNQREREGRRRRRGYRLETHSDLLLDKGYTI